MCWHRAAVGLSLLSHTLQVPCEPGRASPGLELLCPAVSRHAPKRVMPSKFCSRSESLFRRLLGLGGAQPACSPGGAVQSLLLSVPL